VIPLVRDPDILEGFRRDASGLVGQPEALVRPGSAAEVAEVLREAAARGAGVTPVGLHTSTTGASVAMQGWALSLEKLGRVLDLDRARMRVVAEPGVVLGDLKRAVEAEGLFYPPDPTSEAECTLGGTLATNASGARTLKYGPTRPWVEALQVVTADGQVREVGRVHSEKNTAGYFPFQQPVDLFVGSEGTLGVITRATLRLIPRPAGFVSFFAFFRDTPAVVEAVARLRAQSDLLPRCLELMDAFAVEVVRRHATRFTVPEAARAILFFEEETGGEMSEARLGEWLAFLEGAGALAQDTVVALDVEAREDLRRLRHAIPETFNALADSFVPAGGRKVATDFAVPVAQLPGMVQRTLELVREWGVDLFTLYGHVGNGHPHLDLRARDAQELTRLRQLAHALCREAVRRGGTIAAEHGIGKIKREFLPDLYPPWVLDLMRTLKRELDPQAILGPGNIFQ
jgi:FAD/FMN-containing dehydrogenase